ncbi:MAG: hypothetical protein RIT81_02630 [Deltaproteobacteria bacterium]
MPKTTRKLALALLVPSLPFIASSAPQRAGAEDRAALKLAAHVASRFAVAAISDDRRPFPKTLAQGLSDEGDILALEHDGEAQPVQMSFATECAKPLPRLAIDVKDREVSFRGCLRFESVVTTLVDPVEGPPGAYVEVPSDAKYTVRGSVRLGGLHVWIDDAEVTFLSGSAAYYGAGRVKFADETEARVGDRAYRFDGKRWVVNAP